MGDCTYFRLILLDVPEDQREATLGVIRDAELNQGSAYEARDSLTIGLGDEYCDATAALDAAETVSEAMREAAPGATFLCWTDPTAEFLGTVVIYAPDLGGFVCACDGDGNPAFGGLEVMSLIRELPATATRDEVLAHIDRVCGRSWEERIVALRSKIDEARTAPEGQ